MTSVFRISLDIHQTQSQVSIPATQGADNVRLIIRLTEKGNPFDIEDGSYAIFSAVKPDGNPLYNDCAIYRNSTIVYDFTPQTTAVEGITKCQIHLYDTYGRKLHSPRFQIVVHPDIYGNEIESTMEYKALAAFVGIKDDIEQAISNNSAAIAALKEKVTTAGSVTIPTTEWSDDTPRTARFKIDGFGNGMTALLYPSDEETRKEASRVMLSAYPQLYMGTDGSQVEAVVPSAEVVPTKALNIDYIVIKTDNTNAQPRVALIGVDAYGEGGGGTGSGVDETAVKKIINSLLGNVDNVRQYSADNPPPYPVTSVNGKTGAVMLTIPSEAADVRADPVGTAESKTAALRQEVNGKLADYDKSAAVNNKISSHNTSTESHEDLRLELKRLADRLNAALNSDDTSLDDLKEIVAYIKSNKTLIDGITSSKVNVTDIVNNLTTNSANVPLSAAQGVALKLLIDSLEDVVEGKVTAEQVAADIADALKGYQPKGDYLTPSDLPAIPDKLPNPHALTINGKTYDGSSPVSVTVDSSGEEIPSIVLPAKLYAVAGHEFVLYYRNILRAMRPDDFVVSAKISNSAITNLRPLYEDYIRFTPTEALVGQHTITILVKSRRNWATVAEKSVTLVVSADRAFTGKKVTFIGDSLTDDPTYPNEIANMSGGGIVSVGTLDGAEGRSGAASYDYVNKSVICSKYANPFYNPDTEYSLTLDAFYDGAEPNLLTLDNSGSVSVLKHHFDFSYYMENNRATVGEPDAVFINLGSNGGNKTSYKAVYIAFDAMVERIRAYSADLPIFIHLFPPKSEAGSIERNYSGQFGGLLNERTWYYDIIQTYIDRYDNDPRVTLVPTYTMLDTVYDFKRETVAVSARNPIEVTMGQNDGVHPATPGYLHMADSYYNILQALWSGEPIDTYYTVTNNLTNVTNDNNADSVKKGNAYTATLTAASGYTLDTVTVTMGGEAVSVSGGTINISAVTGNIVITATAVEDEEPEEPTVENLVDPSKTGSDLTVGADVWVNGYYASSASAADTALTEDKTNNPVTTDHIPITDSAKIRIYGLDISKSAYKNRTKMVIGMNDGRIFRGTSLPFADTTDGSGATLLDTDGSLLVTVSKFGQAPSWSGKSWARISGKPKDGNNANIVVTVE